MTKQQSLVSFVRKYPDTWFPFARDYDSVSLICATANLGIIEIREDMYILKSMNKARQFLGE